MPAPVRLLCAALLAAGVLGACELAVEVDVPEHDPQLVAQGFFAPDSSWTVRLRSSADIGGRDDIGKLAVTDASVRVTDEAGGYSAALVHVGDGIYVSAPGEHPVAGAAYTLRAEAPGFPSVRAVSSAPAATAKIEQLERIDYAGGGLPGDPYLMRARVQIKDPPGTNYYKLELFRWTPLGEEESFGRRLILDTPEGIPAYDELDFESSETSFRYDDYAYFFDAPEVIGDDARYDGALFSDELFDGQTKSFEIITAGPQYSFATVENRYKLTLSVLSEDYFVYHHTVLLQAENVGELNIAAALLQTPPIHVHSNVEEGLGVFAGYEVHELGFDEEGNIWTGDKEEGEE